MTHSESDDTPEAALSGGRPTDEEKRLYVQIWEKAVDTQMHFNEMSAKSRQLGLTFVAGALGVGVVLLSRGADFALAFRIREHEFHLHVAVLIIIAAALALMAVRILDLNVYHKMLRGAVTFGEDFEESYMKQIVDLEKGMTQAISHFSRHEKAKARPQNGRYVYSGTDRRSAEKKIKRFYNLTFWVLLGVALALLVITNLTAPASTAAIATANQNAGPMPVESGSEDANN